MRYPVVCLEKHNIVTVSCTVHVSKCTTGIYLLLFCELVTNFFAQLANEDRSLLVSSAVRTPTSSTSSTLVSHGFLNQLLVFIVRNKFWLLSKQNSPIFSFLCLLNSRKFPNFNLWLPYQPIVGVVSTWERWLFRVGDFSGTFFTGGLNEYKNQRRNKIKGTTIS